MPQDENKLIPELPEMTTATDNDSLPIWSEDRQQMEHISKSSFLGSGGADGDVVFTLKEQTLENKTLISPDIEDAHSTGTDDGEQTLENKTLVDPILDGGILDLNENELLELPEIPDSVNYPSLQGSAIGGPVRVEAKGDDTNIDLELVPKGTGRVILDGKALPKGFGNSGDTFVSQGNGNFVLQPSLSPDSLYFDASRSLQAEGNGTKKVLINKGFFYHNNIPYIFDEQESPEFADPVADTRKDILGIRIVEDTTPDTFLQNKEDEDSVEILEGAGQTGVRVIQTFKHYGNGDYYKIKNLTLKIKRGGTTTARNCNIVSDIGIIIPITVQTLSDSAYTEVTTPVTSDRLFFGREYFLEFLNSSTNVNAQFTLSQADTNEIDGVLLTTDNSGNSWSPQTATLWFSMDIEVYQNDQLVEVIEGLEGEQAQPIPNGFIPIAEITNRVGQTMITTSDGGTEGYISKDLRPFLQIEKKPSGQFIDEYEDEFEFTNWNQSETEALIALTMNMQDRWSTRDGVGFWRYWEESNDPQVSYYERSGNNLTLIATFELHTSAFLMGNILSISNTEALAFYRDGSGNITFLRLNRIGSTISIAQTIGGGAMANNQTHRMFEFGDSYYVAQSNSGTTKRIFEITKAFSYIGSTDVTTVSSDIAPTMFNATDFAIILANTLYVYRLGVGLVLELPNYPELSGTNTFGNTNSLCFLKENEIFTTKETNIGASRDLGVKMIWNPSTLSMSFEYFSFIPTINVGFNNQYSFYQLDGSGVVYYPNNTQADRGFMQIPETTPNPYLGVRSLSRKPIAWLTSLTNANTGTQVRVVFEKENGEIVPLPNSLENVQLNTVAGAKNLPRLSFIWYENVLTGIHKGKIKNLPNLTENNIWKRKGNDFYLSPDAT